ncbi:hypothetical protein WA158_003037 [Blastocystis sp. Blastoise]
MYKRGDSDEECEDFFMNCIRDLYHFKRIRESTYEVYMRNMRTICSKFRVAANINIDESIHKPDLAPYFCIEALGYPEYISSILLNSETKAHGQTGGLSKTSVANYMAMLEFIMENIDILTDDRQILRSPVFLRSNIKKYKTIWVSLQHNATTARHYEYTDRITESGAQWDILINKTKDDYLKNPNDLFYVNSYLLVLTYDCLCCRNDYGDCKIYTRSSKVPSSLKKSTNYLDLNDLTINVNDTKNVYQLGINRVKTKQEVSEEFLNVLARSLRLYPRDELFINEITHGFIGENKFGEYIKMHLGRIFTYKDEINGQAVERQLITGCDVIRHLFAQCYYKIYLRLTESGDPQLEVRGQEIFEKSVEKMLHATSTHLEQYITPFLERVNKKKKQIDKQFRPIQINGRSLFKEWLLEDKEKDMFLYRRFLERILEYHEDYTDVFGEENFGEYLSEGQNISFNKLNDFPEFKKGLLEIYSKFKNGEYPNRTDLENQLPEGCPDKTVIWKDKDREKYIKYIKSKSLVRQIDKDTRTGVMIPRESQALHNMSKRSSEYDAYVEDGKEHPYATRSQSNIIRKPNIIRIKIPKKHNHGAGLFLKLKY